MLEWEDISGTSDRKGKRLGITDIVVSGYRGIRCDLPVAPDRYEQKGPLGGMEPVCDRLKPALSGT